MQKFFDGRSNLVASILQEAKTPASPYFCGDGVHLGPAALDRLAGGLTDVVHKFQLDALVSDSATALVGNVWRGRAVRDVEAEAALASQLPVSLYTKWGASFLGRGFDAALNTAYYADGLRPGSRIGVLVAGNDLSVANADKLVALRDEMRRPKAYWAEKGFEVELLYLDCIPAGDRSGVHCSTRSGAEAELTQTDGFSACST